MSEMDEFIYDEDESDHLAELLNLAPDSLDSAEAALWCERNGIPLFSISGSSLSKATKNPENWVRASEISVERNRKKARWLSEYGNLTSMLREHGIEICLIKTDGTFPFWSGNVDAIVKEASFNEAKTILQNSGFVYLPWLDEPYKVIMKKFENGRSISDLHLHSRIFWGSTFIRSEDAMRHSREIKSRFGLRVIGDGALAATLLAHSLIENSCIKLIDLYILDHALQSEGTLDEARAIAEKEGWGHILSLSYAAAHASNKKVAQKGVDFPGLKIDAKESERWGGGDRILMEKTISASSFPINLPRVISKGHLIKRILGRKESSLLGREGGVLGIWSIVGYYIRRKIGGQLVRGKSIAVSGPDGSGKSTLAREMSQMLNDEMGVATTVYWSRYGTPSIIKNFEIAERKEGTTHHINNGEESLTKNTLRLAESIMTLTARTLRAKFLGENVIFDRHFLDSESDFLIRMRGRRITHEKIGKGIILRPNLSIVLMPNMAVLSLRSNEEASVLSMEVRAYQSLLGRGVRFGSYKIIEDRELGKTLDDLAPLLARALASNDAF